MTDGPLVLFVGDIHCGSESGLTPTPQPGNDRQAWLLETWAAFVARAKALAAKSEMYLMLGGDLVDLPGKVNRDGAVALLQPLANVAKAVYGVPGTEYHVGENGDEDRDVMDDLGAVGVRQKQVHRLAFAGRELWWAHHPLRLGGQPWTEFDGLYRGAKQAHEEARTLQERYPDLRVPALVVGHHLHSAPGVGRYKNTEALICPCWQLQTAYGAKRVTWKLPTVGAVMWWPAVDRIELLTYQVPRELWSA